MRPSTVQDQPVLVEPARGRSAARKDVAPAVALRRMAAPAAIAAGGLIVVHQGIGLGVRPEGAELADLARGPFYRVWVGLDLAGFVLLLLALTGLYDRQRSGLGTLGLVGYLLAFVGTALAAGDWWFESFVVPWLADVAPDAVGKTPGGALTAGAQITFFSLSIGWVLFGVASLRAGLLPRLPCVLLVVGGLASLLAGMAPLQLPLALAVGWIGVWMYRSDGGADEPAAASAAAGSGAEHREDREHAS